jgi:hypothetical protein
VYLRSLFLWHVTQCVLEVVYRRFGTVYRSHLQGPNCLTLEDGSDTLSWNGGRQLPTNAAKAKASPGMRNVFFPTWQISSTGLSLYFLKAIFTAIVCLVPVIDCDTSPTRGVRRNADGALGRRLSFKREGAYNFYLRNIHVRTPQNQCSCSEHETRGHCQTLPSIYKRIIRNLVPTTSKKCKTLSSVIRRVWETQRIEPYFTVTTI